MGFVLNSAKKNWTIALPEVKRDDILSECNNLIANPSPTIRNMAKGSGNAGGELPSGNLRAAILPKPGERENDSINN